MHAPPHARFARGFTHICGVTCTELVLDVGAALASA